MLTLLHTDISAYLSFQGVAFRQSLSMLDTADMSTRVLEDNITQHFLIKFCTK